MRNAVYFFLFFFNLYLCVNTNAQPGTTIDLKKPQKYENRTLASEKTTQGKISNFRKAYQNTITHYNYFFNANERLKEIISRAQEAFKNDYTKLLPYYNYTLDITASDPDIDSVIYKCNAGILLHDLRNDWVDDLYFTMGKAYYLRKNFDSAARVFSYINYAFAPKDDGYDIPVGSNVSGPEFSIATKEKKKLLSNQPRRNENLLWIAKNYIDYGKPYQASSILEMLKDDPNFPERLQPEWHETMGYFFYTTGIYDSAAFHLSEATDMDDSKQDRARREYLTAQLYMAAGNKEEAEKYFVQSAEHAADVYMAVYANLNAINASADSTNLEEKKIASLISLAKKDRYIAYRDLIYYTAAQIRMQSQSYPEAYNLVKKSIKYNVNNPPQRSQDFMLLGDINYLKPDYEAAQNAYDSVESSSLAAQADQDRLSERMEALQTIVSNIKVVRNEDSLHAVASLSKDERDGLIKKKVRQLRKAQGLSEEDNSTFVNPAVQTQNQPGDNSAANDLFAAQAASKSDWYFNNNTLKGSGFTSFRTTWGNRPDVDNWRRIDAVTKQLTTMNQGNPDAENDSDNTNLPMQLRPGKINPAMQETQNAGMPAGEITYDALLENLPLTTDKLQASNNKIEQAFFDNGVQFQNALQDYNAAIGSYDSLLQRFPQTQRHEEVLFNLYYCYKKLGKKFSADSVASILNTNYKDGKYAAMLSAHPKQHKEEDAATKEYERIYGLFIEGKFDEAKAAKAKADSVYGNSYWTPQLLFIEAIYYITKRDDNTAIEKLTSLQDQFSSSPLADKAQTMIDVLSRRSEIENYLTNLQIERYPEDEPAPVVVLSHADKVMDKQEMKKDTVAAKPSEKITKANVDTFKNISGTVRSYVFNATDQQFIGIILNKVDPVYQNETRNAFNRFNKMNFYNQKIDVKSSKLSDSLSIVLLGPFNDAASAMVYFDKVNPKTAGTIIPWLKPEKYSFTVISQSNLDILSDTKDLDGYKALLNQIMPGKF